MSLLHQKSSENERWHTHTGTHLPGVQVSTQKGPMTPHQNTQVNTHKVKSVSHKTEASQSVFGITRHHIFSSFPGRPPSKSTSCFLSLLLGPPWASLWSCWQGTNAEVSSHPFHLTVHLLDSSLCSECCMEHYKRRQRCAGTGTRGRRAGTTGLEPWGTIKKTNLALAEALKGQTPQDT